MAVQKEIPIAKIGPDDKNPRTRQNSAEKMASFDQAGSPRTNYRELLEPRFQNNFRVADNPRRIVGFIDAPWAPEYADADCVD